MDECRRHTLAGIYLERIIALADDSFKFDNESLIQIIKLPYQDNNYDCGIHVIDIVRTWEHFKQYDQSMEMPTRSDRQMSALRAKLLISTMLSDKNMNKGLLLQEVLKMVDVNESEDDGKDESPSKVDKKVLRPRKPGPMQQSPYTDINTGDINAIEQAAGKKRRARTTIPLFNL